MGSNQDRGSRASARAEWRSGCGRTPTGEFAKLIDRAPQFEVLAKVAQGEEWELTQVQQEFLDDFTAGLIQGVVESEKALRNSGERAS